VVQGNGIFGLSALGSGGNRENNLILKNSFRKTKNETPQGGMLLDQRE